MTWEWVGRIADLTSLFIGLPASVWAAYKVTTISRRMVLNARWHQIVDEVSRASQFFIDHYEDFSAFEREIATRFRSCVAVAYRNRRAMSAEVREIVGRLRKLERRYLQFLERERKGATVAADMMRTRLNLFWDIHVEFQIFVKLLADLVEARHIGGVGDG